MGEGSTIVLKIHLISGATLDVHIETTSSEEDIQKEVNKLLGEFSKVGSSHGLVLGDTAFAPSSILAIEFVDVIFSS